MEIGDDYEAEEQRLEQNWCACRLSSRLHIDIYQNCTKTLSKLYANMGYAPAEARLHKLTQKQKVNPMWTDPIHGH